MKDLLRISVLIIAITLINSCKKDDNGDSTNSVKDIDGNVYTSVTIGTQIWMVENLKTTRYSNGDLIGTTTPATKDIWGENAPKYQWAYDGNESNVDTYGRLYTWYAVEDSRNLCPTGWHVPSDAEWATLATYLGGYGVAGGKLRETGTAHWEAYTNIYATNETGFTALPGGYRYCLGPFDYLGKWGWWWSASAFDGEEAWLLSIYYTVPDLDRDVSAKENAFSIRCLKD